jgi:hypothetical protein
MASSDGTCCVEGCPNAFHAKEMCKAHYDAWYRAKRRRQPTSFCSHAGCNAGLGPKNIHGFCVQHKRDVARVMQCMTCGRNFTARNARKRCDACLACADCGATVNHANGLGDRRCSQCLQRRRTVRDMARAIRTLRSGIIRTERAQQRVQRAAVTLPSRRCIHCDTEFAPRVATQKYCCRQHMQSFLAHNANARRRARKTKAFRAIVYRRQIAIRDGWRCQICHKRIDPTRVFPHPLSFSLDHILPLAAGGTHEPANVQAAHFLCNSTKGEGGQDQLRLIG